MKIKVKLRVALKAPKMFWTSMWKLTLLKHHHQMITQCSYPLTIIFKSYFSLSRRFIMQL